MLNTEPFSTSFGLSILPENDQRDLLSLGISEVVNLFKDAGALLFRGFDSNLDSFARFSNQFTTEFVLNGNVTRETVSERSKTQTVNSGSELIPVHAEMAYSPFRPELIWFHCVTPPRKQGQTILCDGVEVWEALGESLRELFLTKRVKYAFQGVSERVWSLFLGEDLRPDQLRTKLAEVPNLNFQLNDDGTLDLDYVISAVNTPLHREAPAFANSVIVEDKAATFEDGSPITRDLRLELFQITANVSILHRWEEGDVLMIDNSRTMHGRAPFGQDDPRRILIRMGNEGFPRTDPS